MDKYNVKFWASWASAVKRIPEGERGRFLEQWLDRVFFDEDVDFDGIGAIVWDMMAPMIEKDMDDYRNGAKGGRPKESGKGAKKGGKNPSRKGGKKGGFNPSGKGGNNPPENPSFIEAEEEAERESEGEGEREGGTAREDSREFARFVKGVIDAWNDAYSSQLADVSFEAKEQMRKIHANGRTLDDVKKVIETAKRDWDPKYQTPAAVLRNFEELLARPEPRQSLVSPLFSGGAS